MLQPPAGSQQRILESLLVAATAADPAERHAEAHRNLGVAFYKAGMFDEALREFRRVSDLRPRGIVSTSMMLLDNERAALRSCAARSTASPCAWAWSG